MWFRKKEEEKHCDDCIHFTAYDDGDGRWDCCCEKLGTWTDSDGYTWIDNDMKDLTFAQKCKHYLEEVE